MTAVPARTAGVVSRMIAGVVDVAVAAGIVVGSYFAVTFSFSSSAGAGSRSTTCAGG